MLLDSRVQSQAENLSLINTIRSVSSAPIILVSPDSAALESYILAGIDDYTSYQLTAELLYFKWSMLRRRYQYYSHHDRLIVNDLVIHSETGDVFKNGNKLPLFHKERLLLRYFSRNPNKIISTEELFEHVWGWDSNSELGTVMTHISTLRKKVEHNPKKPSLIVTIRQLGYKFSVRNSIF